MTYRECELGGYGLVVLQFHVENSTIAVIAYVATSNNEHYVSNEDVQVTAQTIVQSRGQAGTNREYFDNLIKWHTDHGLKDDYLTELDAFVANHDL